MKTHIKPLSPLDYRSVREMFQVFNGKDLDYSDLSHYWRIRSRPHSIGIFNSDGDILGFAIVAKRYNNPRNLYLAFIAVDKAFRGYELGSKLLDAIVAERHAAKGAVHLVALHGNPRLIAWYSSHGFQKSAPYMNFHSCGTRAMAAQLTGKVPASSSETARA